MRRLAASWLVLVCALSPSAAFAGLFPGTANASSGGPYFDDFSVTVTEPSKLTFTYGGELTAGWLFFPENTRWAPATFITNRVWVQGVLFEQIFQSPERDPVIWSPGDPIPPKPDDYTLTIPLTTASVYLLTAGTYFVNVSVTERTGSSPPYGATMSANLVSVVPLPEPATWLLAAIGVALVLGKRKRPN